MGFNQWAYRMPIAHPVCLPANVRPPASLPPTLVGQETYQFLTLNQPQPQGPMSRSRCSRSTGVPASPVWLWFPGAPWLIWGRAEKHQAREWHQEGPSSLAYRPHTPLVFSLIRCTGDGQPGKDLWGHFRDSQLCGFMWHSRCWLKASMPGTVRGSEKGELT